MVSNTSTQVVNLTGHNVVLFRGEQRITYPPSGEICRVRERQCLHEEIDLPGFGRIGLKLLPTTAGTVQGLPEPRSGTIYLVSSIVLDSLIRLGVRRTDVFAPATRREFGVVRDSHFRIVGTTALMGIGHG